MLYLARVDATRGVAPWSIGGALPDAGFTCDNPFGHVDKFWHELLCRFIKASWSGWRAAGIFGYETANRGVPSLRQ